MRSALFQNPYHMFICIYLKLLADYDLLSSTQSARPLEIVLRAFFQSSPHSSFYVYKEDLKGSLTRALRVSPTLPRRSGHKLRSLHSEETLFVATRRANHLEHVAH